MMLIPPRIQVGAARGTEINLREDQLLLTDYSAQAGQTALVGVSIHVDNQLVEYWLETQINPIADEPSEQYVDNLRDQWLSELTAMSPMTAQYFQDMGIEYSIRMRYQGNVLRIWFAPRAQTQIGLVPLAEEAIPKERWISPEAEVITYPPVPDDVAGNYANVLFSGLAQGTRDSNPEIPGGHTALIATNNNRVQTPPNSLERMHARLQKQVAFNQRVLKNEELIAGINVALAGFLQGMDIDMPLYACVNVGERVRGAQPICGELFVHEDRQMSASCEPLEGLCTSREEGALSGIADPSLGDTYSKRLRIRTAPD
jgi:hypothetical protein